ncbi:glycosyltransferase [Anoxybacillus sp. FSL W8-1294]|uniref:CgeB family protein n=1 Tax=Anoxybacillus sp. FSL W8-1294 TaxID=2954655 RepID=UPI0030D024A1
MKVLLAALKFDYNDSSRGYSFEYENFYKSMINMRDVEVIFFDISDFNDLKRFEENNKNLLKTIYQEKPDVFFYIPYKENIRREVLQEIKNIKEITSVCWFSDDHWRFETFSKELCFYFDYCITTDRESIEKYHQIGYKNVILSQWACNVHTYRKLNLPKKYDVSFVGQPHGTRREIINILRKNGISVACFGYGWDNSLLKRAWNAFAKRIGLEFLTFKMGRVTQEEMIRIFNQSKINLNLSNSSDKGFPRQIKGRNFEVPGCGSFLLTEKVSHLEDYYELDKEVVTYSNIDEMIKKIRYYLTHDQEREAIAQKGYEKTIRFHKYEDRFRDIFQKIGK